MRTRNQLLRAGLLALVVLAIPGPPAPAKGHRPECHCIEGNACWHYLRAPVSPPEDPCSCEFCEKVSRHDGTRPLPKSWSRVCASGGSLNAFLHRHAASWKLSCSERSRSTRGCAGKYEDNCPECNHEGDWDAAGRAQIERQLEIEKRLLGFRPIIIQSPHFYLVTDVKKHKIYTQSGSPRTIGGHEFAHIYVERLEKAYAEFTRTIGRPMFGKRAGVYIFDKKSTAEVVQARYLGNAKSNLLYGGGSKSISGGHCGNGFVVNMQEQRNDRQLHATARHLAGHLMIFCWIVVNGNDRVLPRWMFIGAAHWLSKSHPALRELGTYCGNESKALNDSHKKWDVKARRLASKASREPVEQLFGAHTTSEMNRFSMHLRAWSYFDVFLRDDRERFVAFMARLRNAEEPRPAMAATMKTDPATFDERWAETLLGKRRSAAPTATELDEADPEAPGARVRADIRAAFADGDRLRLAALVRGLVEIKDVRTAKTVLPLLGHESTLVRETAVVVFGRTKNAAVRELLRTDGVGAKTPLVRANVVRALGISGDREAGDAIIEALGDSNWLVEANACRSIAQIRDARAVEKLRSMLSKTPKVRMAAMDALVAFPDEFKRSWIPISGELGSRRWQLRVTAAQALGEMGQMASVEDLIARMEVESGRVREECHAALKKITYDDLGKDPKNWRNWWKGEMERARGRGLDAPKRPPPPKDLGSEGYGVPSGGGEPTYYGIRVFSESVGYVLDISTSMESRFVPSAATMKAIGRTYQTHTKIGVAKEELTASIEQLDPRASFNVVLFRTTVRSWKNGPVPANASNKSRALSLIRNTQANATEGKGETNYYDAFLEVLGIDGDEIPGPGFHATPDTMFFLTDGRPTRGDITSVDELLSWFREENRFARIRCHVIAIGDKDVDFHFLRTLATANDGIFVHLSE